LNQSYIFIHSYLNVLRRKLSYYLI